MGIPVRQQAMIGAYVLNQAARGRSRFPLVLMLEPLFLCNLNCSGCGKIRHSDEVLQRRLSIEECIGAVEECGAPVVSLPGGEPLLHPEMPEIVRELTSRRRFVYLCTNALLMEERVEDFAPSPFLTINIHLDGLRERHDAMVGREGTFDRAVDAIRMLKRRGFRITTNTTLFGGETPESAGRFLDFVHSLGIEGMTVAPAFSFEESAEGDFLSRSEVRSLFGSLVETGRGKKWQFTHSRLYLEFLAGRCELSCSPWGTPTRNIFGWQRPCYLLNDGYARSYRELMETTDWSLFGAGNDPRCADCMVHCGFEPSAVLETIRRPLHAWLGYRGKAQKFAESHSESG